MRRIYLDYAAATPLDKRVFSEMLPFFDKKFGNTMSLHSFGQEAKLALENAREKIARFLNARSNEIIFTSSATESNNLALKGIAFSYINKGNHIIISQAEHPSVLDTAEWLKKNGFKISKIKVDKFGILDLKELEKEIKKETILVSVIYANNEIGTIQPIKEIGKICRERGVFFHTDAAQAFGKVKIDVEKENIDLLTACSQKIYGPKGSALLYRKEGIKLEPLICGGPHEFGLRASTVNVPAIVGFAKAVEISHKEMEKEFKRIKKLREKIIKSVFKNIEKVKVNGHPKKTLPHIINFSFKGIEGESLVAQLDLLGIATSTGSACTSDKLEPSHVLLAIGLSPAEAQGSLRISLGRFTKEKEINYFLKVLPKAVKRLSKISPFK